MSYEHGKLVENQVLLALKVLLDDIYQNLNDQEKLILSIFANQSLGSALNVI